LWNSPAATEVLLRQPWYQCGPLAFLSLFSTKVTDEDKRLIADAILAHSTNDPLPLGKPTPPVEVSHLTRLYECVDEGSQMIFRTLEIPLGWLEAPVTDWSQHPEFLELQSFVRGIFVTNVDAERGCHLASTHGGVITRDEEGQQAQWAEICQKRECIWIVF
jgi:hypothetical protein